MNTERIKYLREELEMTQEEMAKSLVVTRSAYSLREINKNTIPLEYLDKMSYMYDINIDYLVNLSNDRKNKYTSLMIDSKTLGDRIKSARNGISYTQEKLADKLNTTHFVISAYEAGKTRVPTIFLIEIAKLSNKSLNWFIKKY